MLFFRHYTTFFHCIPNLFPSKFLFFIIFYFHILHPSFQTIKKAVLDFAFPFVDKQQKRLYFFYIYKKAFFMVLGGLLVSLAENKKADLNFSFSNLLPFSFYFLLCRFEPLKLPKIVQKHLWFFNSFFRPQNTKKARTYGLYGTVIYFVSTIWCG